MFKAMKARMEGQMSAGNLNKMGKMADSLQANLTRIVDDGMIPLWVQ